MPHVHPRTHLPNIVLQANSAAALYASQGGVSKQRRLLVSFRRVPSCPAADLLLPTRGGQRGQSAQTLSIHASVGNIGLAMFVKNMQ